MTPTIDRTSITAAEWRVVGSETKPHLPLWLGVDRDPNRAILALHQILDSGASYRPLIGWIFGPELIPNRALLGAAEKFLEFRALQNSGFLQATSFMILRRPQTGLRAVSSSWHAVRVQSQVRGAHHVPQLTHHESFKRNGVPDVLSPEGFELAWTQYQATLVEKLNLLTAGTPDENATPGTLLVKYARQASMASLFNYASMAHNNHFFFNCLSPGPVSIPDELVKQITESCSSVESLRADFIATANAMFGPGFVWLVKSTQDAKLKILSTYIAGSPYPAAHYRLQPVDMATQTTGVAGGENPEAISRVRQMNRVGAMGQYSHGKLLPPGGIDVHPILCVNTWEHVWLRDWGVGGKAGFLEAWWDRINWEEVAQNYRQAGPEFGFWNKPRNAQRGLKI